MPPALRLIRELQALQAELAAVAEQGQELAGVVAARDDHDLVDAGQHQRLDRIEDHRLVVDRQQVLVGDPRERMQSGARAAGENDALHVVRSSSALLS